MKRSDALNKIKDIVHKNTIGRDGHPVSDTAQEILNCLENLGMAPPKNTKVWAMDFENIRNIFFWESENEEK